MMGAPRALVQRVHAGAGGVFGLLLFVILLSGAWSMVHEDLRTWFRGPATLAPGSPLPLGHWLQVAREHGLAGEALHIRLPDGERSVVELCAAANACGLTLDPVDGRELASQPAADLLFNLHKSLFIGFPGRILVSLLGVVLLLMICAGGALHSGHLRDLKRLRLSRGPRVLAHDLHSLIGAWAAPWLLLFGITGAMSGLGALGTLALAGQAFPGAPQQAFMQLLGAPPRVVPQAAPPQALDLDRLLRDDAAAHPGFIVQSITLHRWGAPDAWLEVAGIAPGLPSTAVFERRAYRGDDGQPLGDSSARGRGLWLRAFIAVQPLHFADYRWLPQVGPVLRAVHFGMALAAAALVLSGLFLWLERRRLKAGAGWQVLLRLVIGGGGGLLTATAVLLCAGALANLGGCPRGGLVWWFWGCWSAALLLALALPPRRQPLRLLLSVAGLAFLGAGSLHLVDSLAHANLSVWPIDLVLLLGGIGALWVVRRLTASTRTARAADANPV
ncbi:MULTISPECIES: PepSY-associated TM helix domain-containing protein [unclassified Pseudomonas]|uniref:PepSY-associated TM helix domain-containing protein n=1 Tax=unclassified Pseudomonas TaxID=196821 RepID=UPI002446F563|nr:MULTISPECIES: PepSY-associated TM helix domain-containing protein [unclassified Pseudomonas]MDH0303289.1 PepSY domain-containing protein [Pseudomonas sp. GD04091]MDH1985313.1 PepSY domain-containing protein [Pseudomonas sp. GD03689]